LCLCRLKNVLNFWYDMYQILVDQNGSWQYFTLHISINTCILL
jgi:hypothetical protein